MALDWNSGPLAEGLHCYRTGQFFEAHEHWESIWLASPEPERTFLQAIIQVSAAFHHLNRGNRIGAVSLLSRALRKLHAYPDEFAGVAVARLREDISDCLIRFERKQAAPQIPPIRGRSVGDLYSPTFAVGSKVRVITRPALEAFARTWPYHHKLLPEQMEWAGAIGTVKEVSFYHGGDQLYVLEGVPGIWNEPCLESARENEGS